MLFVSGVEGPGVVFPTVESDACAALLAADKGCVGSVVVSACPFASDKWDAEGDDPLGGDDAEPPKGNESPFAGGAPSDEVTCEGVVTVSRRCGMGAANTGLRMERTRRVWVIILCRCIIIMECVRDAGYKR
jgi:hypothetical protein